MYVSCDKNPTVEFNQVFSSYQDLTRNIELKILISYIYLAYFG